MATNLFTLNSEMPMTAFTRESLVAGRLCNDYDFSGAKTVRVLTPITVAMNTYKRTGTMEKFDYSAIDVSQLSWMVQADNTTPWSESVQMQTLEKLYAKQILTDAYDYVQAIPSSQLKNKQQILKKIKEKIS